MLGTIQQMVQKACSTHGVEVQLQRPHLAEAHRWEEVFITSTSRGVLSVHELRFVEGTPPRTLLYESTPLSDQLHKWVSDEMLEHSTKLY
jgi:branched-subunit amino acid aminotransferase/4-amino-4-deoxychorismate lyase